MARLARYAWIVLFYNVGVILWGAYVRATGSGAGCGAHWPLCNGQVIPRAPTGEMLVEFSHRLTSGLALIAVVALLVWVLRATAQGHPARTGAWLSVVFILTEAAVGAGLVLFQLVADNESVARAMFMAVHLVNTFVLVACLALTAHWLSGGQPVSLGGRPGTTLAAGAGFLGLLLVGVSGAVAALGDTLFPAQTLAEALASDVAPTSHLFVRLRVLHPGLAIAVGLALIVGSRRFPLAAGDRRGELAAYAVTVLAAAQILLGFLNVLLLAPVWMQLVHLLLADALWIAYVLLVASVLSVSAVRRAAPSPALTPATR